MFSDELLPALIVHRPTLKPNGNDLLKFNLKP